MCFGGGGSKKAETKPNWTNRDKADYRVFAERGGVGKGKDFRGWQQTRNDMYIKPASPAPGSSLLTAAPATIS